MAEHETAVILLAAGKGTRMKSDLHKVLHRLAGKPLVNHALDASAALTPAHCVVVVGPGMEDVAAAIAPHPTAVQARQQGTADAVLAARETLSGFGDGDSAGALWRYADDPGGYA